MTNFNDLANLQAGHTLRLLGGVDGVYSPPEGDPVPCCILIEKNVLTSSDGGLTTELNTVATVDKNEVYELKKNGKLSLPGAQYTVLRIQEDDGFQVQAIVR